MDPVVLSTATEGLTSGFTQIASSVTEGIASVAPVALTVMGAILVWRVGAKFFKSVAK